MAKNTLLCHRSTTRQNDLTFIPKTPESTARFERGGWSICSSNVWSIYLYRRGSQCINTLQLESPLVCSALPSAQLSAQARPVPSSVPSAFPRLQFCRPQLPVSPIHLVHWEEPLPNTNERIEKGPKWRRTKLIAVFKKAAKA